tara:strand:- start:322 stop:939 length:618 start_codon:yes stop_codon:yes gene_type:complete
MMFRPKTLPVPGSEISLNLKLDRKSIERLNATSKYGVKNTISTASKWVMKPARDDARKLSGTRIKGTKRQGPAKGLRGVGETYSLAVFNNRGEYKKTVQKKVRAYRAGIRKASAYRMSGRSDSFGGVTFLLSVNKNADYYNFVANFWEHGWTAKGRKLPGNQFMTRAVDRNVREIGKRFRLAIEKSLERASIGKRLKASDLKGLA